MLSTTNLWMSLAGLFFLFAGVLILRNELRSAQGWDKLISLAPVFIAASLACFAPEHFGGGPDYIQAMAPSWMPWHWFWPTFVGIALFAAAASLIARKCMRLSSTMLGLMFFLFVCMIYLPSLLRHPENRFAWAIFLRDLSFCAGAWAITGLLTRTSSPQLSKFFVLFSRIVIAVSAVIYSIHHFLHPEFTPGVPLQKLMPSWIPIPTVMGYFTGAVLLIAGIALFLNKNPRIAAASIGAWMTALTVFPYLVILFLALDGSATDINEGINYVADTLLYAGSALAVASALPHDPERMK